MPAYACDDCGKAFRSKQALKDHMETHSGEERSLDPRPAARSAWTRLRGFSRKQLLILFAVVLMSTLFVGTAFFASTFAPSGGGIDRQGRYVNPLTGYSQDRLPQPSSLSLPPDYVAAQPLGEEAQLFILFGGSVDQGPAILLQYSCGDCPETVSILERVADRFEGYVYVAPYSEMEQRVAATAYGNIQTYDEVDVETLEQFVCSSFQRFPVRFRPLACGVLGQDASPNTGTGGLEG